MQKKTVTKIVKVKKEVSTYTFSASFANAWLHTFEIRIEDGELVSAIATGPYGHHDEYFSSNKASLNVCKKIIENIAHQDLSELKNMYSILNDGPIKDLVRSIQKEWLEKLSF